MLHNYVKGKKASCMNEVSSFYSAARQKHRIGTGNGAHAMNLGFASVLMTKRKASHCPWLKKKKLRRGTTCTHALEIRRPRNPD